MHLSIFISVFNQLDAQNLFHNKFYFMPLHVSSICAHHQGVKIALHSLWYHHTYSWPSRARVEIGLATYRCDDTRGCVMQFWPPDDEHMCSKHVEARNKTYCETLSLVHITIMYVHTSHTLFMSQYVTKYTFSYIFTVRVFHYIWFNYLVYSS